MARKTPSRAKKVAAQKAVAAVREHFDKKRALLFITILLLLLYAWRSSMTGVFFKTSTLNTSFNRLSSTQVTFAIPEPGKLSIKTGPTNFLSGANVFALTIASPQAAPATASTPFTIGSSFQTIFNQVNPDDTQEMVLAFSFPEGTFTRAETVLAELPFTTTTEGQFQIRSIAFGNVPTSGFPAYQDYPIYIESANILFDDKGAAKLVSVTTPPPTTTTPACSDKADNDADGKIDHPIDPGCSDPFDTDEKDPEGPKPLRLELPSQNLKIIQGIDQQTENIVILPPAQEQLFYQFTLKVSGGTGAYSYAMRGRTPNQNNAYVLGDSGLILGANGVITGAPDSLRAGNYRYPLSVTDNTQVLNFSLQIAISDALGNPVGVSIETNFAGTEHRCRVNEICEAFFKANKGIEPYLYSFSGESPIKGSNLLQVNAGQAFYRFTPTLEQVGSYQITVAVTDSSKPREVKKAVSATTTSTSPTAPTTASDTETVRNTASISFTLVVGQPEIASSFKFAAEESCNFLDLSNVEPEFDYFQFTCRNGVMQGSKGLVRAEDAINRAEAAKVTTLIVSDNDQAENAFSPFVGVPQGTPVNFDDVTVGDWYAQFVYYLFKEGIIVDNLLYRPGDTLNAAEAMKLVIESYAALNEDLLNDLIDITDFNDWFQPYQTVASYVDANIAYVDPASPAERGLIAELLYKLYRAYPVQKFK